MGLGNYFQLILVNSMNTRRTLSRIDTLKIIELIFPNNIYFANRRLGSKSVKALVGLLRRASVQNAFKFIDWLGRKKKEKEKN